MDRIEAQRAIATLHSFRFFGLVFILPGVAGNLPTGFADFAAYGDFATGLLAILALLTVRMRPLFWLFVVAFNIVGAADLIGDYYHAIQLDLPAHAGEFGALYAIPILYVPLLMITHFAAFYLLVRRPSGQSAEVGLQMPAAPSSELAHADATSPPRRISMPSIASIIRHTPWWAFGCLAIIVALGIQALKTRTILRACAVEPTLA